MEGFLRRVLIRSAGILDRLENDGNHLIFNPATGRLGVINGVGFDIWMLLDGQRTLAEILRELCKHYRRPEAELASDMEAFIEQLEERELVQNKKGS